MSKAQVIHQPGVLIGGQFLLERMLGAGGMGSVWVAEDTQLRRPVAIKFLSAATFNNEQARQRFEREARLASRIRSPHVVQMYAQGRTPEGAPYLVMELLDGEDLAARIERTGPLSLMQTATILQQLASALSRAHRDGLVHRDIKPHNVFLCADEHRGRDEQDDQEEQVFVKLLDFGIAKDNSAPATALTLTGAVMGTAYYISPEQLANAQSVGPSTDIWALGVVAYEMLTGAVPFEGPTFPELIVKISQATYPRATRVNPALPRQIDGFFEHALQPNPTQRFATVDALSAAFSRIAQAHTSGLVMRGPVSSTGPHVPGAGEAERSVPVVLQGDTGANASRPPVATPRAGLGGTLDPSARKPRWLGAVVLGVAVSCVLAWLWLGRSGTQTAPPSAAAHAEPHIVTPHKATTLVPPTAATVEVKPEPELPRGNAPAQAAPLPAAEPATPVTSNTLKDKKPAAAAAPTPAPSPRAKQPAAPAAPTPPAEKSPALKNYGF
jgi:eukaryotic-like serine/threonine-protein kinase